MARKPKISWAIYRKTEGSPFPGEHWEDVKDLEEARAILAVEYADTPHLFHIVRQTLEVVT
jgi:hypothetical protein